MNLKKLLLVALLVLIGMFVVTSCSSESESKAYKKTEIGPLPVEVTWNGNSYTTHGEGTTNIGQQIGKTSDEKLVFEIKGEDSSVKIAVKMLSDTYIVYFKSE